MCSRVAAASSFADEIVSQPGYCACQTSVWPRTSCPAPRAASTISSPGPKSKRPRDGSTVSHFISFSGVSDENCVATSSR